MYITVLSAGPLAPPLVFLGRSPLGEIAAQPHVRVLENPALAGLFHERNELNIVLGAEVYDEMGFGLALGCYDRDGGVEL
jgi:hypothetical protein